MNIHYVMIAFQLGGLSRCPGTHGEADRKGRCEAIRMSMSAGRGPTKIYMQSRGNRYWVNRDG